FPDQPAPGRVFEPEGRAGPLEDRPELAVLVLVPARGRRARDRAEAPAGVVGVGHGVAVTARHGPDPARAVVLEAQEGQAAVGPPHLDPLEPARAVAAVERRQSRGLLGEEVARLPEVPAAAVAEQDHPGPGPEP